MEIEPWTFLARYGEIQSKTEVVAGATVKVGQKIASVGHLVGIRVPGDMLHFELYDKSVSGPFTVASDSASPMKDGVPFMRRKDLIDPTLQLNQCKEILSTRLSYCGKISGGADGYLAFRFLKYFV